MRILLLADEESKYLYDHYSPEKLAGVDLIIGCGDLPKEYLEFFATMSRAPVLYVLGNHDRWYRASGLAESGRWQPQEGCRAEGCICIEDDIFVYRGVRILGLGGSMRYQPQASNQYTEGQMRRRILKLWWKFIRCRGIDILVTHAPAAGIHDLPDLPHRGFACFAELIAQMKPKLFVHGHVHATYGSFTRRDVCGETVVVNAYDHYFLDYPETEPGKP